MFNVSDIRSKLNGVVGFREPIDPDFQILTTDNKQATSGKYLQDYSAYVTVQNIKDTQPYAEVSDANFNSWLSERIKDAAVSACQSVFEDDDLIENRLLYDYESRKTNLLENRGDFVGYEITVSKNKDIKAIINQIITEFSGTGKVKLLMFHSGFNTPLETIEIDVADTDMKSTELEWSLPYDNTIKGGKFYIGYLTNGLPVKAINREWDMANIPNYFKRIGIEPMRVPGHDSETLFDVDDVEYTSETYGLNFDISVYRDFTSLIIRNKNKMADAIGYQFAVNMVSMMMTSPRNNRIERLNKGNLFAELNGTVATERMPTTAQGIQSKLESRIKDLKRYFYHEPMIRKLTVR
jgi:hypothetical protein